MNALQRPFRIGFWPAVLLVIFGFGLYAAVIRFAQGLGSVTNLSDEFPWGLWVGFDVLVGVGLAAGGFVIAATVHVFRIERYEPIARPAVLTAFLGYVLVIVALLFDLGLPYRIWHPLVMWNPHSVMFEVSWCVTLYATVLALEFSPLVFERLRMERPLRILRALFVPLVIAGVLLSTLHQSSLGTFYVIVPDKLHPLWYSPLLPVFFFLSAVAGGLAMTVFESFMSARAFGKRLEADLLRGLARVMVVVLAVYTVWKLEDLGARGALPLLFQVTPESVLFWGEMGLGALLPMALLALPRVRRSPQGLFFAAVLTVLGFIVNRLNVAITGMAASSGVLYLPTWMELAVTASMVAGGFALFALAVKHLPVFPAEPRPAAPSVPVAALGGGTLAALWGLLLIGALAVGWSFGTSRAAEAEPAAVLAAHPVAAELRLPAPFTFPASAESPGPVVFDHVTHVDGERPSCGACHRDGFRLTGAGTPVLGAVTYERVHAGDLCASCHDGVHAFAVEEGCELCHQM